MSDSQAQQRATSAGNELLTCETCKQPIPVDEALSEEAVD